MKLQKTYRMILATVAGLALMGASVAMAAPILDFGVPGQNTGSISYDGSAAPLIGNNISVTNVIGLDTPLNNGFVLPSIGKGYNILEGVLNFQTGNFVGSTSNTWNFGGGSNSFITMTGVVDVNGNGIVDTGDISGTLMTGGFGTANVLYSGGVFKIAGASFFDFKDPELLALFGLPAYLPTGEPLLYAGNFNISFTAEGMPADAFRSTRVMSGDITNTPVPEPGTIVLLGAGLLGLGFYGRKRIKS
jgi:hypothetical protein